MTSLAIALVMRRTKKIKAAMETLSRKQLAAAAQLPLHDPKRRDLDRSVAGAWHADTSRTDKIALQQTRRNDRLQQARSL